MSSYRGQMASDNIDLMNFKDGIKTTHFKGDYKPPEEDEKKKKKKKKKKKLTKEEQEAKDAADALEKDAPKEDAPKEEFEDAP